MSQADRPSIDPAAGASLQPVALRLAPGEDLREAVWRATGGRAAFVLQGVGSLSLVQLRYAGKAQPAVLEGDFEILTLAGTVAEQGVHLHISVADARGRVRGGHLGPGSLVRTTAEILLAVLPAYRFTREPDVATGYAELCIAPCPGLAGPSL